MTTTITIANGSRYAFDKFFKKLARKCTRLHIENPPSYQILENTVRERKRTIQTKFEGEVFESSYEITVVDVVVSCPDPVKVAGQWECFAVLERTDNGSMEAMTTGFKNNQDARAVIASGDMKCVHCNTKRVRNTTLLFRNEQGQVIQIGKECAKEYQADSAEMIALFEFQSFLFNDGDFDEDQVWGGGGARMNRLYELDQILELLTIDQIKLARPFVKTKHWDDEERVWVENYNSTKRTIVRMMRDWMELEEKPCTQASE